MSSTTLTTFYHKKMRGFTLIELVMVIAILGLTSFGFISLITSGFTIFSNSNDTEQVLAESRLALERITRELRNALPNSLRLLETSNYQCLEFMPIVTSTRYIYLPIAPDNDESTCENPDPVCSVITDGNTTKIAANQWAIVYPFETSSLYADLSSPSSYRIKKADKVGDEVKLTFTGDTLFKQESPQKRVFFTDGPVSYCFQKEKENIVLRRYANYGVGSAQLAPDNLALIVQSTSNGSNAIVAQHIDPDTVLNSTNDAPFSFTPPSLTNNAIVHVRPKFKFQDVSLQYYHQVQINNVP